jgi:CRP-like cAMP-binding protein
MIAVKSTTSNDIAHSVQALPDRPLPSVLMAGLSPQDMLRVNAARPSFRTLKAGETLYFQGDRCRYVYLLLDGWAFRHKSLEDGRRQILDFALPGSVVGFPGTGFMGHSVESLTPCTFSVFTRESLFDLLQRVPALSVRFMELMASAESRAYEHLTSVGRRTARERVANLLAELVQRTRRPGQAIGATRISVPLMQPHIADALGLASETVCRSLAAMRKDGVIVLRSGKLEILSFDRLLREAGMDPDDQDGRGREPSAVATAPGSGWSHRAQTRIAVGAYH